MVRRRGEAGRAVAQGLDGEQVHGLRDFLAFELGAEQRDGGAHGIDEHACWLGGIVGVVMVEGVADRDAAQMGDADCG